MERINQEIGTFLRHYMNYQQDDWMNWLAAVEFQYNNKKHAATGKTLFKLNFGRHPWKGDLMVKTDILRVEDFHSGLQRSWEQATKAIEVSRLLTVDFILFSLCILFYFTLLFLFLFLFLEQLRLGLISHAVTSVTN